MMSRIALVIATPGDEVHERADDHLVDVLSQSQPHGGYREHHCDAARDDVDEDGVGLPAFQREYDKEHRQPNDGRAARVRERPPEKKGEGKRDQHIPRAPPRWRGAAQAADRLQLAVRLLQRDLPPADAPAEGVQKVDAVEVGAARVDAAGLADRAAVPKRDRHDDAGRHRKDVRLPRTVGAHQPVDRFLHAVGLRAALEQLAAHVRRDVQ